jgi:hypothetical protein
VAESSLKRDVEVFLRTYVPPRRVHRQLAEDSLDCPLVELGLITQHTGGHAYRFHRGPQPDLPDLIVLYALLCFWDEFSPTTETLALHDLTRQPGSPGRLFKIDESSLAERLERMEVLTEGGLSYGETAGLRQLYRRKKLNPFKLLADAYAVGGRSND